MLIRSEVEIQLAVIIWAVISLARQEEFTDIVRGESRLAKYAHDLKHGSAHLEVVLDDGNETVGDDGDVYLYAYCVFRLSPEPLDLEVLLDPLEEKLHDVILGEQGTPQDSHDLHDWTSKLEVVLNDSDETVCDDGDMDLNTHRIVTLSPERLDPEVLLDPFEEQLDLPPVFIKEGDVLGIKIEVVRVVDETAVQLFCVVDNPSESTRVLLFVFFLCEADALVFEHIVCAVKHVFAIDNLICWLSLLPEYEESAECVNRIETGQVEISSVKHIAGQRFVSEPVHCVDIVDLGIGDAVEHGYLRDDVNLRVNLDARLGAAKLCPLEHRHTEVDCGRVDGIESAVQFKLSRNPFGLGKGYHVEGKLFKDPMVSEVVGLGKHLLVHRVVAKSEMFRFPTMGGCYVCKFPETPTAHQLTEHQYKHVAPMRQRPAFGPVVVLDDNAPEMPLREELNYLCEHESSNMHICSDLKTDAKVRIQRQVQAIMPRFARNKDSLT